MSFSRNRILVAIDFEQQSLTALEQSFSLARLFNAGILLLYVIEEGSGFKKLISPDEYHRKVIEKAREKFDEIEHLARVTSNKEEIPVSWQIEKGKPYDKILEAAADDNIILIVMGKGGETERKRSGFLGSNTLNVVREALCPVITLDSSHIAREFKNILIPVDFTGQTKIQVQLAIDFGKFFNATINVLSVLDSENKINRLLKQVQLNQIKNALMRNKVECNASLITKKHKHLAADVCEFGSKIKSDLVIIFTRHKKHFSHSFIGLNAQEIIFSSPQPVMSINPDIQFHPELFTSFVDPLGLMKIKEKTTD